jgi:DNA-binding YbaB/EbfC family protein
MNIMDMMRQAKEMQERLQKQMAEVRVEATAGGGMVTVVMNGAKQVQSLVIDPTVLPKDASKEDVEMLQDMIVAALNDAQRKVDERMGGAMQGMLGGLKIPGLS